MMGWEVGVIAMMKQGALEIANVGGSWCPIHFKGG